jgi:hypothetical protein
MYVWNAIEPKIFHYKFFDMFLFTSDQTLLAEYKESTSYARTLLKLNPKVQEL